MFLLLICGLLAAVKASPTIPRQYLPLAEAAEWLGTSKATVRRRIAAGDLRGFRFPGSRLIFVRMADVEAVLREIPTASH